MTRYLLLLQYDGTDFCGWQRQKNGVSVQETVERALKTVFSVETAVTGSGRTDAGVSAAGQVAHFDADLSVPPEKIAKALNGVLPPSVRVLKSEVAPEGFHARFSAKQKTYVYTFYTAETELPLLSRFAAREIVFPHTESGFGGRNCTPPAESVAVSAGQNIVTKPGQNSGANAGRNPGANEAPNAAANCMERSRKEGDVLDFPAMERAAKTLLGTHDFAAFSSTGSEVKDTVRTVYRSDLEAEKLPREMGGGMLYRYTVTGSGFLYNMVRIIAGTLIAVGNHKRGEDVFLSAFSSGNRDDLGKTAKACGLILQSVEYPAVFSDFSEKA